MGRFLRVTHPSAAVLAPEGTFSLDLHVLGLPPAFNLSHDQTLQFNLLPLPRGKRVGLRSYPRLPTKLGSDTFENQKLHESMSHLCV